MVYFFFKLIVSLSVLVITDIVFGLNVYLCNYVEYNMIETHDEKYKVMNYKAQLVTKHPRQAAILFSGKL